MRKKKFSKNKNSLFLEIINFKLKIPRRGSAGFTLVELLVVVAIIGVLSAILMANFIAVRQRARDAQRKSDLRQIQAALELYRSDNAIYPTSGSTDFPNNCGKGHSITGSGGATTYMQTIPCDPLGLGSSNYNGGIYYYTSNGSTYTLVACLENGNDQDGQNSASLPSGAPTTNCTSQNQSGGLGVFQQVAAGWYYILTNP